MAEFRSKFLSLQLPFQKAQMTGEIVVAGAKFIVFENGAYSTNDKEEITFLREPRWKEFVYDVSYVAKQIKGPTSAQTQEDTSKWGKNTERQKEDLPQEDPEEE